MVLKVKFKDNNYLNLNLRKNAIKISIPIQACSDSEAGTETQESLLLLIVIKQ